MVSSANGTVVGRAHPWTPVPLGSNVPSQQGRCVAECIDLATTSRNRHRAGGERWESSVTSDNGLSRRSFLTRSAAAGGAVVLGAGASSLLAGCSSGPSTASSTTAATGSKPGVGSGAPVRGGTLTIGTIAEIDGFYPPTNHWDTNG